MPVMAARIEAEAVGTDGIILVGRTTPIDAARTATEYRRPPLTGSRKEDVVAVALALYFVAVHAIHRCPFPGAVVD